MQLNFNCVVSIIFAIPKFTLFFMPRQSARDIAVDAADKCCTLRDKCDDLKNAIARTTDEDAKNRLLVALAHARIEYREALLDYKGKDDQAEYIAGKRRQHYSDYQRYLRRGRKFRG